VLKALIVDDEPPARAELRYQLEAHGAVAVVGEAATMREALELLAAVDYDVVFLDIEMPGGRGLETAQRLHGGAARRPFVVFVTAHDEHALAAYELAAVDYLLKPVSAERLAATVARLELLAGRAAPTAGGRPGDGAVPTATAMPAAFVTGMDGERTVPVPVERIAYLCARGDGALLGQTDGRRLTVRTTLEALERRLPPEMFVRCHRAYIVNVREVAEIVRFFNGTYLLKMNGRPGLEVPVSRGRARRIRELFHL
jgi:DNA-binding LytR/AlgR family response regulator